MTDEMKHSGFIFDYSGNLETGLVELIELNDFGAMSGGGS